MLRKLTFVLALVVVAGFALAQTTIPISPTDQGDDVFDIGTTSAEVAQTVTLKLPQATALHLASTQITFDLTGADPFYRTDNTSGLRCVYTQGPDVSYTVDGYYGQAQVIPGGIAYVDSEDGWDKIEISGKLVDSYPPIKIVDGALDPDSKDYFVCYQSFVLQLFSNVPDWQLTVARADHNPATGIEHLYVQGNTCADFGEPTGLYDLPNGQSRNLIPTNLNNYSTGDMSQMSGCNANSSWHDILGVLAVKVNSDSAGANVANLTYTLVAPEYVPPQ